jgi:hypothetical protein
MSARIHLPDVTLVSATSVDISDTLLAFAISMHDIDFGSVKFLTPEPPPNLDSRIEWVPIPEINFLGYSKIIFNELHRFIDTPYCLVIQADGFVLNAASWTPDFLEYDYIGAPWSRYVRVGDSFLDTEGGRVGNGGFSLRSKKLLEVTAEIPFDSLTFPSKSEDLIIGHYLRKEIVEAGVRFPAPELAAKFSIESPDASFGQTPNTSFGFHGKGLRDLIFDSIKNA